MTRFIILVAALISIASAADFDWRVVGGSKATDGQFPYQVSMRMSGEHGCGGSILNEKWILTAGHCVYGAEISRMSVVTGTNKLNKGGDSYYVKRYRLHDNFTMKNMVNDIALLEIYGEIKMNEKVQPIKLPEEDIGADATLILSGWGRTSYPGDIPNDLQFINLRSIANSDCNDRHHSTGLKIHKSQICTLTKKGEGACHGDSGGPLVSKDGQVGIVSWGRPCGIGYPDVFTRVSHFIDWINTNMN